MASASHAKFTFKVIPKMAVSRYCSLEYTSKSVRVLHSVYFLIDMLPRTPAKSIPFAITTPRHTAPKQRASKSGGELLSFASPTPDSLFTSHVGDHPQSVGSGSSHRPSRFLFRLPVTFGSQYEPLLVEDHPPCARVNAWRRRSNRVSFRSYVGSPAFFSNVYDI
jgi:hypothetical protein